MSADAAPIRVSVIIPALEEEHWLPLLLSDLARQTLKPAEILVVDGGSADRTRDVAATGGATVIASPRGVGHQRDLGGHTATGNLLVFLDADTRLEPGTLAALVAAFTQKRADCACPRFRPWRSTVAIRAIFAVFNAMFWLLQKLVASGAGCCIVVTAAHFQRIGGFRSDTVYDDIAFIRAASRAGRFSILPVDVFVSDRRFRREGTLVVLLRWLALCPFFFLGIFKIQRLIPYRFAHYQEKSENQPLER